MNGGEKMFRRNLKAVIISIMLHVNNPTLTDAEKLARIREELESIK